MEFFKIKNFFLLDKRTSKRSLKLLRGSERDLKLDISRARVGYNSNDIDERAESLPIKTPTSIQVISFFICVNM